MNIFRTLRINTEWRLRLSDTFAVYKAKGVRIYYRKEYKIADILDLFKRVENYQEKELCHMVRYSKKSVVFLDEIPFWGIPKKVVIKHILYRSFFDMLGKTFFGTRGERALVAANTLVAMGFATPQPIALIEKKSFGFVRDNFVVTEYIDKTFNVRDYLLNHFNSELNPEKIGRKKLFIEELAKLVRLFHDTGLHHCDLSGGNILIREVQHGNWEMFIIDLDSVSLWKKLTLKRRLRNLSQINDYFRHMTNADKMRFFKTYFGSLPPKAHEYVRWIFERSERRRLRRLRRAQLLKKSG